MALDVDSVCTEAQLIEELGGNVIDAIGLRPVGWDSLEPARSGALERVLSVLRGRTPPIHDTDLATPTELKRAVLEGAKMHLYELAMSTAADGAVFYEKWKAARQSFRDELAGLNPTLTDGLRGPAMSFSFARR